MKNDPYELKNLAEDPKYSKIKDKLLQELNSWRELINDKGVTSEFREGGWPADYPTRTIEEWEIRLKEWEPWVFREANSMMKHLKKSW